MADPPLTAEQQKKKQQQAKRNERAREKRAAGAIAAGREPGRSGRPPPAPARQPAPPGDEHSPDEHSPDEAEEDDEETQTVTISRAHYRTLTELASMTLKQYEDAAGGSSNDGQLAWDVHKNFMLQFPVDGAWEFATDAFAPKHYEHDAYEQNEFELALQVSRRAAEEAAAEAALAATPAQKLKPGVLFEDSDADEADQDSPAVPKGTRGDGIHASGGREPTAPGQPSARKAAKSIRLPPSVAQVR